MRSLAVIATAGVLALSLSGCFGNPVENLVEGVIEDQTGIDVDVNSDGSGASLPEGWPAEVPTPAGTILSSFTADDVYSATISVADEAAALAGLEAVKAAGFTVDAENDLGELKSAVLNNGTLGVTYAILNDSGAITVTIGVAPRG